MPQDYVPAPAASALGRRAYISEKEGRYQIIADRYIGEAVVKASPEHPAVISLPAGSKIDSGLTPLDEGQEPKPVKLAPHHAGEAIKKRGAAQHFGRLIKHNAAEEVGE
jgi:hypothetical protein